jgi:hypothetical protein
MTLARAERRSREIFLAGRWIRSESFVYPLDAAGAGHRDKGATG